MLSATLYRFRKDLAKKPWIILIVIIAIAFSAMMIWSASLSSGGDEGVLRDPSLAIGGINVILIVLFDFIFVSGLKNGVVGFSFADVNFHLAGPFSQKFNLMLAASGVLKMCLLFLWVLVCQSSVLGSALGLNSTDMIGLIVGALVVLCIGYLLAAFLGAYYNDSDKAIKNIEIILGGVNALVIGANLVSLLKTYGSFQALGALGLRGIIATAGSSMWTQLFPIAGWTNLVYSGLVFKDMLFVVVGVLLIIATAATVFILYNRIDIDYYETAIAGAQKVADAKEAKKAGIDSDTASINRKVKVGNETLTQGWGASAFTYRHLLENKRATKFFFVNPLAILYRLITLVYMFIMSGNFPGVSVEVEEGTSQFMPIMMGLTMMVILNAIVYGGGKTVLEFTKPFIFLAPEKSSKKLMSCLLSELPEMIFDSILCAGIMWYFAKLTIVESVAVGIMMIVFDFLFELVALVCVRIFTSLGRVLLVVLRTFIGYAIVMVAFVPGIAATIITGSLIWLFVLSALAGAVMAGLLLLFARNMVDNVELA